MLSTINSIMELNTNIDGFEIIKDHNYLYITKNSHKKGRLIQSERVPWKQSFTSLSLDKNTKTVSYRHLDKYIMWSHVSQNTMIDIYSGKIFYYYVHWSKSNKNLEYFDLVIIVIDFTIDIWNLTSGKKIKSMKILRMDKNVETLMQSNETSWFLQENLVILEIKEFSTESSTANLCIFEFSLETASPATCLKLSKFLRILINSKRDCFLFSDEKRGLLYYVDSNGQRASLVFTKELVIVEDLDTPLDQKEGFSCTSFTVPKSKDFSLPTNFLPTNFLPTNFLPTNFLPTNFLPTNFLQRCRQSLRENTLQSIFTPDRDEKYQSDIFAPQKSFQAPLRSSEALSPQANLDRSLSLTERSYIDKKTPEYTGIFRAFSLPKANTSTASEKLRDFVQNYQRELDNVRNDKFCCVCFFPKLHYFQFPCHHSVCDSCYTKIETQYTTRVKNLSKFRCLVCNNIALKESNLRLTSIKTRMEYEYLQITNIKIIKTNIANWWEKANWIPDTSTVCTVMWRLCRCLL